MSQSIVQVVPVSQDVCSVSSWQFREGPEQVRVLDFVPVPHVTLHAPHSLHGGQVVHICGHVTPVLHVSLSVLSAQFDPVEPHD